MNLTRDTRRSERCCVSALTRGPDGAFYISECGYHCNPGDGRILRVAVR